MTFDYSAFNMSGKVALVTGGSRGLGRAMVEGFAQAGANVVVASRNGDACVAVADEVAQRYGVDAVGMGAHVGHWDELDGLVAGAVKRFGKIDVLVNNAGMSPLFGGLSDLTETLFDKVIAVNLKGPFRLATLVGERMVFNGGGSIINISSTVAVRPRPESTPYAAAKAGLNAVTVALARAFAPTVRCNAIMPGTFLTDVSKTWNPAVFAERTKGFALGRGGEPEEIVGAALYLASDASSYTTGSIIAVDGGQS